MAKYRCPKCENVFEGRKDRCPNCDVKMAYPNQPDEDDILIEQQADPAEQKRNRFLNLREDEVVLARGRIVNLPWVYLSIFFFLIGAIALIIGLVNRFNGTNLWFRNLIWLIIAAAGILLGILFIVLVLIFNTRLVITDRRIIVYRGQYLNTSIMMDDITYLSRSNGMLTVATNGKRSRLYHVTNCKTIYNLLIDHVVL